MDIKQLKTLIAVAETASLSKASDRLKLGQPALSRHIKMLEIEVGASLFVRHGRGMEPTVLGAELVKYTRGLVYQLEKSIEVAMAASGPPTGHVTLGVIPTVISMLATKVFRRIDKEYSGISLSIIEGFPGQLVDLLQRGSLDAAILTGPGSDLHLRTIDLLFENLVLVGDASGDLDPTIPVSLNVLAERPLILPGQSERHRNPLELAAQRAGISLNVRYEVESFTLAMSLVEDGLGYTVVPLSAVARQIQAGDFCYAPFAEPGIRRQLVLALPTSRPDSRATTIVQQILLEEVAHLIEVGAWNAFPDELVWSRITANSGPPQ